MTERIAIVLGAGGAYGWVFHAGVLHGIERALNTPSNDTKLIIGTSAGSAIGAAVRAGIEPRDLAEVVARPPSEDDRRRMRSELRGARKTLLPFAPRLVQHALSQDRTGMLGVAGLLPPGIFPTAWLARFPGMDDHAQWPEGLWIPAVSATTGDVVVFGRDRRDVDVHRAAQASSAVPGMFQPHVIDGTPYLDGGVASPTHADLAADIEPDLVIISSPMTRPGRRLTSGHARRRLAEEIATLEKTDARVTCIEPDTETGRLADGFPRSNGSNASRIFESAAALAERSVDATLMRQPVRR
jgi:NTE family protein